MIYLTLLKRFWPFIAGALLLIAAYAWHRSEIRQAVKEYSLERDQQEATVLAARTLANEKALAAAEATAKALQSSLVEKLNVAKTDAEALHSRYDHARVCFDQIHSSGLPKASSSPTVSDGGTESKAAVETFGGLVIGLVQECQHNTDKLVTLQTFLRETH
jgi:hypothetical protein